MRFADLIIVAALLPALPASAARRKDPIRQYSALPATEAAQAPPGKQCLLYARPVRSLTDLAVAEMGRGEDKQASATLRAAGNYISEIEIRSARNRARRTAAEILMRESIFRIRELLMDAPLKERPEFASVPQENQQDRIRVTGTGHGALDRMAETGDGSVLL